jgi:hypothetical protein
MKKLFLLLCIFCLTSSVFTQSPIDEEEYSVYRAILGSDYNLAINKFTSSDDSAFKTKHLRRDLKIVQTKTSKDFKKKNKKSYELQNNFLTQKKVFLLTIEELRPFYEKSDEDEFAAENAFIEKYGTVSLVTLSRVGFNNDKTQAVVEVVYNSGFCGNCSTAYLFILTKEKEDWKIIKKLITWIS